VIGEVEKPLFRAVLTYTNGNQSEAAEILGINRGTLRKKLKDYKLQGR
jgi:Fis family transcriptional regulator